MTNFIRSVLLLNFSSFLYAYDSFQAGDKHTLFITENNGYGTLLGLGSNTEGQVGEGDPFGGFYNIDFNVETVSATKDSSIIKTKDGLVYYFGRPSIGLGYQQLHNESVTNYSNPDFVGKVNGIAALNGKFLLLINNRLWIYGADLSDYGFGAHWGYRLIGSQDLNPFIEGTQLGSSLTSNKWKFGDDLSLSDLWAGSGGTGLLFTHEGTEIGMVADNIEFISGGGNHYFFGRENSLYGVGPSVQFYDRNRLGVGSPNVNSNYMRIFNVYEGPSLNSTFLENVHYVATYDQHSLILDKSGGVRVVGKNEYGQLGVGDQTSRSLPIQLFETGITSVSVGKYHSLVVKNDGSLWGFGSNEKGQLGVDGIDISIVPIQILSEGVIHAEAGGEHSLVLKNNGQLIGFGDNSHGQIKGDGGPTHTHIAHQVKVPSGFEKKVLNLTSNNSDYGLTQGSGEYLENMDASLIASPYDGYEFVEWKIDSTSLSTDQQITYRVAEDVNITAIFAIKQSDNVSDTQNSENNNSNQVTQKTLNIDETWIWVALPWVYLNQTKDWLYLYTDASSHSFYSSKDKLWYLDNESTRAANSPSIFMSWGWNKLPWIYSDKLSEWVYLSSPYNMLYSTKYSSWYKKNDLNNTWELVE